MKSVVLAVGARACASRKIAAGAAAEARRVLVMKLAMLALVLNVAVPPGYMPTGSPKAAPFALVICTGHGPIAVASDPAAPGSDQHPPAPAKSLGDHPCVFTTHAQGVADDGFVRLGATALVAYPHAPEARPSPLKPGNDAAGPPLPPRGPPALAV